MNIEVTNLTKLDRHYTNHREYNKAPRIFISLKYPTKDVSVHQYLDDRRSITPKEIRPFVIEELKKNGIHPIEMRWSRKAGCRCGCSPGFILNDFGILNAGNPSNGYSGTRFDCWVECIVK